MLCAQWVFKPCWGVHHNYTGRSEFKGMKFLGEQGTLQDSKTLAKNLQMCATFFNPTCWLCLSLFLREMKCWEVTCLHHSPKVQVQFKNSNLWAKFFFGTLIILSLDFKMEELCRLLSLIQQFPKRSLRALSFHSIFKGKYVLISKIISQELEDLTLIDQSWRCSTLPEPFALVHILRSFGLSVLKGLKLGNILLKLAH